ncbi:hypothetical protein AFLA_001810 [Aspergillus flavus NRRL3357]|nr:hypothetical protein AFLA_001810 [Aspergillus flavus NRRL3357]
MKSDGKAPDPANHRAPAKSISQTGALGQPVVVALQGRHIFRERSVLGHLGMTGSFFRSLLDRAYLQGNVPQSPVSPSDMKGSEAAIYREENH